MWIISLMGETRINHRVHRYAHNMEHFAYIQWGKLFFSFFFFFLLKKKRMWQPEWRRMRGRRKDDHGHDAHVVTHRHTDLSSVRSDGFHQNIELDLRARPAATSPRRPLSRSRRHNGRSVTRGGGAGSELWGGGASGDSLRSCV